MERSMNLRTRNESAIPTHASRIAVGAAWHGLLWLVTANAIGVLIAILLLLPNLNRFLGEWTYGRWVMVHMNLELYGWTAIPMVAFLFRAYGADRGAAAQWSPPILRSEEGRVGKECRSW